MEYKGYYYQKYNSEDASVKRCPGNDLDGSISGQVRMNLQEWFDENPEERKRLGWIKHITHNPEKELDYNKQTQFYTLSVKKIDDYTVEDIYYISDKSEKMLLLEDMLESISPIYSNNGGFIFLVE